MTKIETDCLSYVLEEQIGFLLRRANQRHLSIFAERIPTATPTQFAALAQLARMEEASQNALGRATAMDGATIKGVVDRLRARGLVASRPDPEDNRRILLALTQDGRAAVEGYIEAARQITADTLAPLDAGEQRQLLALLARLG